MKVLEEADCKCTRFGQRDTSPGIDTHAPHRVKMHTTTLAELRALSLERVEYEL